MNHFVIFLKSQLNLVAADLKQTLNESLLLIIILINMHV